MHTRTRSSLSLSQIEIDLTIEWNILYRYTYKDVHHHSWDITATKEHYEWGIVNEKNDGIFSIDEYMEDYLDFFASFSTYSHFSILSNIYS